MSSSRGDASLAADRPSRREAMRTLVLVAIAAPVLAACEGATGFRPMYGVAAVGGAGEKLAQVEFATIPGRVGQRIRNELVFQSTGGGHPLPPSYRLDVAIREQIVSTLVRKDGDVQSQIYNLEAKFQLIRLSDKKVVFQGTSFGRAAFERYNAIFSNVRAREDAEDRAASTIALDIRSRLGAYLSGAA